MITLTVLKIRIASVMQLSWRACKTSVGRALLEVMTAAWRNHLHESSGSPTRMRVVQSPPFTKPHVNRDINSLPQISPFHLLTPPPSPPPLRTPTPPIHSSHHVGSVLRAWHAPGSPCKQNNLIFELKASQTQHEQTCCEPSCFSVSLLKDFCCWPGHHMPVFCT